MDDLYDVQNKNNSNQQKNETNNDDNLKSTQDSLQQILNNDNVFKIIIILIACLNKLHQSGNSVYTY